MTSLRREAISVYSALPSSIHTFASASSGDDPTDPDWPHRVLALLSEALCDQAVPLTPDNQGADAGAARTIKICDLEGDKEGQSKNCVSEALVQRLWEITSYAERELETSRYFWNQAWFPYFLYG